MEYPPGCTCALALARLEAYLLRTLSRLEALAIAEHLEACPPCAHHLAVLRRPAGGSPAGDPATNV